MQVGIIGAGRMGSALARVLARAGYVALVANRRGRVSLMPLMEEIGSGAMPVRPDEAARAPVVVLAVPWSAVEDVLDDVGPLPGTVLVDATNPWQGWDAAGGEVDSSQAVARLSGGARVVKALNTVHAARLDAPAGVGAAVAGDDADAVDTVAGILTAIGFTPVRAGSLAHAGPLMAPHGPLFGVYEPAEALARRIPAPR